MAVGPKDPLLSIEEELDLFLKHLNLHHDEINLPSDLCIAIKQLKNNNLSTFKELEQKYINAGWEGFFIAANGTVRLLKVT